MIVWISGAYGVGKSTFAEALADKVDHAVIFDAEKVGDAVIFRRALRGDL